MPRPAPIRIDPIELIQRLNKSNLVGGSVKKGKTPLHIQADDLTTTHFKLKKPKSKSKTKSKSRSKSKSKSKTKRETKSKKQSKSKTKSKSRSRSKTKTRSRSRKKEKKYVQLPPQIINDDPLNPPLSKVRSPKGTKIVSRVSTGQALQQRLSPYFGHSTSSGVTSKIKGFHPDKFRQAAVESSKTVSKDAGGQLIDRLVQEHLQTLSAGNI